MELTADVTASEKQRPRGSKTKSNRRLSEATELPIADDLALILSSLQTMRDGDFSARLPVEWTGLKGKIADTFNDIISANERIAGELKRVGQAVGKEGRTRERTRFQHSRGSWGEMEVSVNTLVEDLLPFLDPHEIATFDVHAAGRITDMCDRYAGYIARFRPPTA